MSVLDALAGTGAWVRPGGNDDAVAGVLPSYVATPGDADQATAVLRAAAEHGLAVVPRGNGTKAHWGSPPHRCDLVVDTRRLDAVLEHAEGDLVVRVQAGCPIARLADTLGAAGQRLALDVPVPGSTVGGTLATAVSGPRRLAYGTARDLLIGITVVRADGVLASSGGRVVKNVAGYDLGKLFTGSLGTLGLIVTATFRLHPNPPDRVRVEVEVADAAAAHRATQAVLHAQLVPSAIELDRPARAAPGTLTVLLEGGAELPARAAHTAELLGGQPRAEPPPDVPDRYPAPADGTLIKATVPIADLPHLLDTVDAAGHTVGLDPAVRGSAGAGVYYLGLPADANAASVGAFLAVLRPALGAHGGSAVVLHAPPDVNAAVDLWGPVEGLALMRRVKDGFDPENRLAPGRFVGGI